MQTGFQCDRPKCETRGLGTWTALGVILAVTASACGPAYYKTMETFGLEKRHLLVDRVEDARESQEEARGSYRDALEALSDLLEFDGGDLEKTYRRLEKRYARSVDSSREVRQRIDRVENVAEDLFDEWEEELDRYEDASLRIQSEAALADTRDRYTDLIRAMRRAAVRIEPALQAFEDQVLYLKHNLNAQAIGALGSEVSEVRTQVDRLIEEIDRSIAEAESFLAAIES